ncbi:hypothetical protein EYD10_04940 [Varanus komodoensis]|nr:hypothetical protein EYD10_04940 [Varanus komodoensis]
MWLAVDHAALESAVHAGILYTVACGEGLGHRNDPPDLKLPTPALQQNLDRIRFLRHLIGFILQLLNIRTDFEKTKSQQEQEEKLIITAWYNMGLALHQRATEDRSSTPPTVQSFLAQQRLATSARRGHLSRAQPLLLRYIGADKPSQLS